MTEERQPTSQVDETIGEEALELGDAEPTAPGETAALTAQTGLTAQATVRSAGSSVQPDGSAFRG